FLQVGEVGDAAVDSEAQATIAQKGAEAEGGDERVAPAAITFLGGENVADELLVDGVVGLAQLVEADEREGASGDGAREVCGKAIGKFGAGVEQFAGEAIVLACTPETLDLAGCLHLGLLSSDGVR